MARNKNFEKLFDRTKSSVEIIREAADEQRVTTDGIRTWGDFFSTTFSGTLEHPRNASCIMRWHMPDYAPQNKSGQDVQIPILSIIEDSEGEIWMAYLTNPSEIHWKFLFLKPHRETLLAYLRGETNLLSVYQTTRSFYICTPDLERDLLELKPEELASELIPGDDSFYSANIWFDTNDIYYGMNVAPYNRIVEWAKSGRFYWH